MADARIKARLEELRTELRAERISMGELAELQSLAEHIEPGDVELLEPAGVPEYPEVCLCGAPLAPGQANCGECAVADERP